MSTKAGVDQEGIFNSEIGSRIGLRAERTLKIMHEWGYAPSLATLADQLLGGQIVPDLLEGELQGASDIRLTDGFVCLRGFETLIIESKRRTRSNRTLNGSALVIAQEFASDLASMCPFVECIALSGSVASGGFDAGDDIDFDLVVRPGTKYICYLAALMLGLKYSLRYRRTATRRLRKAPLLPKIICINVVWPSDQTRPFARQDEGMAFELLRCQPLIGHESFREVLWSNRWLVDYFPQMFDRAWRDSVATRPTNAHRLLLRVGRSRFAVQALEAICRTVGWMLYRFVQAYRKLNPVYRARATFLSRVKYPYEVFQDSGMH